MLTKQQNIQRILNVNFYSHIAYEPVETEVFVAYAWGRLTLIIEK